MNRNKVRGALGLSQKAGKCVSGDFSVEQELKKKGSIKLLVLDSNVSASTTERYARTSDTKNIPIIYFENPGECIGKSERMILAITDDNFVKMIQNAFEEDE